MGSIGNSINNRRIRQSSINAEADSARAASRGRDQVLGVEERFDRLKLLVHAMWSLIEESTDLTEDDLAERIRDIDASDGNRNGYYRPAADKCECGAAIRVGALRCQFCGAEATDRSPFNTI